MIRQDVLNQSNTTDREKLLHTILVGLALNTSLVKPPTGNHSGVHLVYYRDPQEGDLVIGMTTGEIGYLERVSKDESGNNVYLINVLGTDEVVEWQEEIFRPILGSSASRKDSVSGNDYTDIL